MKPQLSVVVPVYNSELTLRLLHQRLSKVLTALGTWELILVNDCSKDNSWTILQDLCAKDKRLTAINLANNFGQHNAIMCGLSFARGDLVITMDDDLQHPPEEITKLVAKMHRGRFEVVYGQYTQKNHGWFRDQCSKWVNKLLSSITGSGYSVTSFRIMQGRVASTLAAFKQYNVMIDVLIKETVSPQQVGHCLVEHHKRELGTSNYSYKKLISFAANMIFNYTVWPLRLATLLGFLFSFLSIALGFLYIIYYFTIGISVSGWTSLILTICFFAGVTLFVIGIIGEYVGRIFLNVNQKPQYVIRTVLNRQNK